MAGNTSRSAAVQGTSMPALVAAALIAQPLVSCDSAGDSAGDAHSPPCLCGCVGYTKR